MYNISWTLSILLTVEELCCRYSDEDPARLRKFVQKEGLLIAIVAPDTGSAGYPGNIFTGYPAK